LRPDRATRHEKAVSSGSEHFIGQREQTHFRNPNDEISYVILLFHFRAQKGDRGGLGPGEPASRGRPGGGPRRRRFGNKAIAEMLNWYKVMDNSRVDFAHEGELDGERGNGPAAASALPSSAA
jgi:hypothetical protein